MVVGFEDYWRLPGDAVLDICKVLLDISQVHVQTRCPDAAIPFRAVEHVASAVVVLHTLITT